jgi:hypothetical protein
VSAALGLADGLAVNALSTDVGYRGAAAVAAFVAILLSTKWLRELPPRAPLVRFVFRALLGAAAIMVLAAAISHRWEALATIVATVLTTSAVLIQTDLTKAGELLGGVALIGGGVAAIGLGVDILRHGEVLYGVALIGGGVAAIGLGVAVLRHGEVLGGVAVIGGGVALIGGGVALIGLGVALIGLGVAVLRHGEVLYGVALIGVGVALIGGGVDILRHGEVLYGVALIGGGVAAIGGGVAVLHRTGTVAHTLNWLVSLTKDPANEAPHRDNPAPSGLDNPAPEIHTPPSKPPPIP